MRDQIVSGISHYNQRRGLQAESMVCDAHFGMWPTGATALQGDEGRAKEGIGKSAKPRSEADKATKNLHKRSDTAIYFALQSE